MADTTILQLNKLTSGSHSGTWGDLTNDNMSKIDVSIKGYTANAITGTLSNNTDIVCPAQATWYFVDDSTDRTGSNYTLTFKPSGGTGVALVNNAKHVLYTDGSTMFDIGSDMGNVLANGDLTVSGDTVLNGGTLTYNSSGADKDAQFYGDTDNNLLFLDASTDRVGIGVAAPAAKLEVDQTSGTGGIPVLELDQGDGDQPFVNCAGTSASDSSASISDATTTGSSKVGAIRIQVNGATKWIRIYDTAV